MRIYVHMHREEVKEKAAQPTLMSGGRHIDSFIGANWSSSADFLSFSFDDRYLLVPESNWKLLDVDHRIQKVPRPQV